MKKIVVMLCLMVLIASSALADPMIYRETLYQGSTIEALLAGNYDGVATVKKIKSQGNMGLGTFTGLDGEMIVLDGKVYKAAKDGKVTVEKDNIQSPFYAVTYFDADITKQIKDTNFTFDLLKKERDQLRTRNDLPYAVIIKGQTSNQSKCVVLALTNLHSRYFQRQ